MGYETNGKQVLHVQNGITTRIADAENTEMAHAIVTRMNDASYIDDARRTLSPSWHGDKISKGVFLKAVNDGIEAANKLDQVKKTLFYGRDNNLIAVGQNDLGDLPGGMVMPAGMDAANVIHAIIGKFTEAGELLEALRNCYNGDVFDRINAIEEIGDGFWYDAILLNEASADFGDAQRINIAKLKARFPDSFGPDYANNRNLEAERAILEGKPGLPIPLEATPPVGGGDAVRAIEASADTAFASVQAVTDAGAQNQTDVDLSVGIGERLQDMPGENLARQPVRKSDLEK